MARELAQRGASVILVNTISAVRAAQQLIPPVPVITLSINDPVGTGLIGSLARPGGHTTGMATMNEDVAPKMLEFQQAIVPQTKVLSTWAIASLRLLLNIGCRALRPGRRLPN